MVALIGVALLCSRMIQAAEETNVLPVASGFFYQSWQTEEGLPHNDVHGVVQAADGFLWVGTRRGMARFDGTRYVPAPGVPGLLAEQISVWRMYQDPDANILTALEGGGIITQKDGVVGRLMAGGEPYAQRVVSLCSDLAGRIWTVSLKGEVERVSEAKVKNLGVPGGSGTGPSTLARDGDGVVWLASKNKLGYFQGDEFIMVKEGLVPPLFVASASAGGVWLVTPERLYRASRESGLVEVAKLPWRPEETNVRDLLEDRSGALWFGTSRLGLIRFADGRFQSVETSHNNILSLAEDRTGNLWVGTQGGGLNRVRARQFKVLDTRRGLPNDSVFSFAEDGAGRVWMATQDGGLCYISNSIVTVLGEAQGWVRGVPPLCLAADDRDGIWIGTQKNGLLHWNGHEFKFVTRDLGLRIELLNCVLMDRAGRVWAGSMLEGLYCVEGDRVKTYTVTDGLPGNGIRCLAEDKQGALWVGTDDGGIAKFTDGTFQTYKHAHWAGDSVRALLPTEDGSLWLGTIGGGLLRFKGGVFAQVNSLRGLPDDSIQQLMLDDTGWLWCGTSRGLFRAELQQLNAVAERRAAAVSTFSFGRSDGLPGFQFNGDFQPAALRTRAGRFWFASVKGAVIFQPGTLSLNREAPVVSIESITRNGEPVTPVGMEALAPGVRLLEFRFTVPEFSAPERVRFRHRLDDVGGTWSQPSESSVVVYTNVPPGNHRFQVRACNADGVWSEQGASIAFAVAPFFWQTRWFPAAAVAVLVGLFALAGRWVVLRRLRHRIVVLEQERALDRERARIAQDIHDELGANLTTIGWLADRGKKHAGEPATASGALENIASTARESLTAMDAIVWALNPRNDSLENFANYISHFANEFFRPTAIRCRMKIPTELPQQPMSTEARHHLFLALKEALNNVARHAEATKVWIAMDCNRERLLLTVEDNGRGLKTSPTEPGQDGLGNIRRRLETLGGTLTVESGALRPGRATDTDLVTRDSLPADNPSIHRTGTRLEFLVPLTKLNS